jgi:hypothetical protein
MTLSIAGQKHGQESSSQCVDVLASVPPRSPRIGVDFLDGGALESVVEFLDRDRDPMPLPATMANDGFKSVACRNARAEQVAARWVWIVRHARPEGLLDTEHGLAPQVHVELDRTRPARPAVARVVHCGKEFGRRSVMTGTNRSGSSFMHYVVT